MIIFIAQIAALLFASILIGYCFALLILQLHVPNKVYQLRRDHEQLLNTQNSMQASLHNCESRLKSPSASVSSVALSPNSGGNRPISDGLNVTAQQPGESDDLKKISGIGKVIETTLNELGIYRFSQVADFSQDDIDSVNNHLRFKGRIQRENWVSQAQDLCAKNKLDSTDRNTT